MLAIGNWEFYTQCPCVFRPYAPNSRQYKESSRLVSGKAREGSICL
jgi:hypothetical protein